MEKTAENNNEMEYKRFVDYSDLLKLMDDFGINGYTVRPSRKFEKLPVSQKTILNMKNNGNVEIFTLLALAQQMGLAEITLTMTEKGFKVGCKKEKECTD